MTQSPPLLALNENNIVMILKKVKKIFSIRGKKNILST